MTERIFRFIQGVYLVATLLLASNDMMYGIIIMYTYEGLTNLRIPLIVSKLRYGKGFKHDPFAREDYRFNFDAERAQRFMAAGFLYITYFVFPDSAWFGPWFLAGIFLMAGFNNVCPSVMLLRWMGFR